jgi:diaminopimelate epimerase
MRLTKHHGLANDFLVLIDLEEAVDDLPGRAARACDRHRGVGADGLLHVTAGRDGADVTMALYNADGSRAEMSGNGIGCLAQAVVMAGVAGPRRVEVATDVGRRAVDVTPGDSPRHHRMRVDMGEVRVLRERPDWVEGEVVRALSVDAGNPHVVLEVREPAKFPIDEVGRRICDLTPGGVNVEAVAEGADGELVMVVYERGVGVTEACGTGACAAAVAALEWGLPVDRQRLRVAMPGGTTEVEAGPTVFMTTPIVHVATVDFHWP